MFRLPSSGARPPSPHFALSYARRETTTGDYYAISEFRACCDVLRVFCGSNGGEELFSRRLDAGNRRRDSWLQLRNRRDLAVVSGAAIGCIKGATRTMRGRSENVLP